MGGESGELREQEDVADAWTGKSDSVRDRGTGM